MLVYIYIYIYKLRGHSWNPTILNSINNEPIISSHSTVADLRVSYLVYLMFLVCCGSKLTSVVSLVPFCKFRLKILSDSSVWHYMLFILFVMVYMLVAKGPFKQALIKESWNFTQNKLKVFNKETRMTNICLWMHQKISFFFLYHI